MEKPRSQGTPPVVFTVRKYCGARRRRAASTAGSTVRMLAQRCYPKNPRFRLDAGKFTLFGNTCARLAPGTPNHEARVAPY